MKTYYEKLKDPRWQKKRLSIMQRDGFKCKECDDNETTLHVHHIQYRKAKNPWEYPDSHLITLCEECHESATIYNERVKERIVEMVNVGISIDDIEILLHAIIDIRKNKNINWHRFEMKLLDLAINRSCHA